MIPKDWQVLNLGSSSTLKARIGWQGLTTAEYLNSGDYFLVTGTDFKTDLLIGIIASMLKKIDMIRIRIYS